MKAQIAEARLRGDIETRAWLSSASLPPPPARSLSRHVTASTSAVFHRRFSRATTDVVLNFLPESFPLESARARVVYPKILPALLYLRLQPPSRRVIIITLTRSLLPSAA